MRLFLQQEVDLFTTGKKSNAFLLYDRVSKILYCVSIPWPTRAGCGPTGQSAAAMGAYWFIENARNN